MTNPGVDLPFKTDLLLKTVASHQPVTYAQLGVLAEGTPINSLRRRLDTLAAEGLIVRDEESKRYETTEAGAKQANVALPPEVGDPDRWGKETDMCLSFLRFARDRETRVAWHRSRQGVYDIAIIPLTDTEPPLWAIPHAGSDHAMIPLAVRYVTDHRLGTDFFDWARKASRRLYGERGWRQEGFPTPPALVLALSGKGRTARRRTVVEYAHDWQEVLEVTVPGTSETYRQMFAGAPHVLICDGQDMRQNGPKALTASLTDWQLNGLWATHRAKSAKAA